MKIARLLRTCGRMVAAVACQVACARAPERVTDAPRVGQWIWTRADVARYAEALRARPDLEAAVFIGSIRCDPRSGRLIARAGLPLSAPRAAIVTAVIRFEDGLDRCRVAHDGEQRFDIALDSAVRVLRSRGTGTRVAVVQLDYDAPQRALAAWAGSVRYLAAHALLTDAVWVTSLIAHLREPSYGALFRDAVQGHVLQVFDTGEEATTTQVDEALRVAARADMPFRLGVGAFERVTRGGRTDHRAWFTTIDRFSAVRGFSGVWVFPAGHAWHSLSGDAA